MVSYAYLFKIDSRLILNYSKIRDDFYENIIKSRYRPFYVLFVLHF